MLKILIFSPNAMEYGRGGEISSIELAAGLEEYYDISVIDTNLLPGEGLLSNEVIEKKLKGVKRLNRLKFAKFSFSDKLFSIPYPCEMLKFFKYIKKSDIFYSSVSNIKTNILLVFFSLLHRQGKFIIGYRKPLHIEKSFSLYNLKMRASILLFSLFKNRFYHHTISANTKKYLEKFNKANRVIHIIHGVELDDYKSNLRDNSEEKILKFIYVGHLDKEHKGIDILVSSIKSILDENKELKIHVEFCGSGPLAYKVKELEEKHPKKVKYNGYISIDKIHEYYKRNNVFFFTSRREPFGRVIIEALAAKLLIICTKTTGSIEILKNREFAFFLPKLEVKYIEEKIYEIINLWKINPERFNKLQESAKEYAFQNYSFSIELEMFKKLINKINNE